MSITITHNHNAVITNKKCDKKVTIPQLSRNSLSYDKLLVKVLEQTVAINIDPEYILNYSTKIIAEYVLKLSDSKLLVVNIETSLVNYDENYITETSPGIYNFTHNSNVYTVEFHSGYFTLKRNGSLEEFSSNTGQIN